MTGRALRLFWWAYWSAVALLVVWTLGLANGARIERAVAPTHAGMVADRIVRTPDRLCWTYTGRKLKATATDDLDTYLYSDGVDGRMVVAPYGEADGLPWRKAAAVPVGAFEKRYCIDLPAGVPDGRPIRFELTAYYPGAFGPWRVPVPWPPVPAAGLPDADPHPAR